MTSIEQEPHHVADFVEVARELIDGDALILSRNRAQLVRGGRAQPAQQVHYESLSMLEQRPDTARMHPDVTDKFGPAAAEVVMGRDVVPRGRYYPLLRVRNVATGKEARAVIDVAGLLLARRISVYGETILGEGRYSVDSLPILNELTEEVGVDPDTAIVADKFHASTLRDTSLGAWTRVPKRQSIEGVGDSIEFDDYDPLMLSALQVEVAEEYKESVFADSRRVGDNEITEVVIPVTTHPDMQHIALTLIDAVEKNYKGKLCCLQVIHPETGDPTVIIRVVDEQGGLMQELAFDEHLPTALYKAYLLVTELFSET